MLKVLLTVMQMKVRIEYHVPRFMLVRSKFLGLTELIQMND